MTVTNSPPPKESTHLSRRKINRTSTSGDTAQRLRNLQTQNRATEVYVTQVMPSVRSLCGKA
jgi:hypothetical protein